MDRQKISPEDETLFMRRNKVDVPTHGKFNANCSSVVNDPESKKFGDGNHKESCWHPAVAFSRMNNGGENERNYCSTMDPVHRLEECEVDQLQVIACRKNGSSCGCQYAEEKKDELASHCIHNNSKREAHCKAQETKGYHIVRPSVGFALFSAPRFSSQGEKTFLLCSFQTNTNTYLSRHASVATRKGTQRYVRPITAKTPRLGTIASPRGVIFHSAERKRINSNWTPTIAYT